MTTETESRLSDRMIYEIILRPNCSGDDRIARRVGVSESYVRSLRCGYNLLRHPAAIRARRVKAAIEKQIVEMYQKGLESLKDDD